MSGLLGEVLQAHGGLDRFNAAGEIAGQVASGGFAFASRFTGKGLRDFRATVSTGEPRSLLEPYPGPGRRGVFTPGEVRIESDAGELLERRAEPREAFRSFRHNLWWDDLDALYFAGYAIINYLSAPFLFVREGFEVREVEPWSERGEPWRRLEVRFPAGFPTHSREQVFYYDDELRLRRHDYTAEPFGSWARAAHLCARHERFDGLEIATSRRVYPRGPRNRPLRFPTLVWIELKDVALL